VAVVIILLMKNMQLYLVAVVTMLAMIIQLLVVEKVMKWQLSEKVVTISIY